jgi:tellurite resistance protein TerC
MLHATFVVIAMIAITDVVFAVGPSGGIRRTQDPFIVLMTSIFRHIRVASVVFFLLADLAEMDFTFILWSGIGALMFVGTKC